MTAAFLILAAYLIGSVPFGLILAHLRGVDIRAHGSGNIGATNVGRVLGRKWGALCFALDLLKGLLPTLAAGWFLGLVRFDGAEPAATSVSAGALLVWLGAMSATVVGHMFPVWLRFKGGKGVATGFGALLGVWPVLTAAALGALLVWLVCVKLTRMVGISSVLAALSLPVFVLVQAPIARALGRVDPPPVWPFALVACALAAVVVIKHRTNIARTLAGTEHRVGRRA
ncbi:MAG: glycerol-3-phosphate 1-O-acyltransferase PlsY [Phycisphaeraceae bacterium]|nr:glycerol-3-phosphate 1-O-acyltransferase PlsY [Phycisphaeraceae bacterium]MBX3405227.1 glycerol-3-phosphate 1-O-acyltransferase PlsY [Phycisphaeraceae bacterium]